MIPTEGFPNPHVVNKDSPRRDEIKLRKNEMKLRRNQMKLRRNFFSPTWRIKNSHVELEVPHVAIRMLGLSAGEVFGKGGERCGYRLPEASILRKMASISEKPQSEEPP